jgi:hypothetical protein
MKTLKTRIACLLLASAISGAKMNDRPATATTSASDASNSTAAFKIGQPYHGGIIFYVDSSGQHGLIASVSDLVTPKVIQTFVGRLVLTFTQVQAAGQ